MGQVLIFFEKWKPFELSSHCQLISLEYVFGR